MTKMTKFIDDINMDKAPNVLRSRNIFIYHSYQWFLFILVFQLHLCDHHSGIILPVQKTRTN